jgi:uncharacterized protein YcbK (DUF882 family)
MGDLSRNFSRKELECPCCGSYIENKELVGLLQAIRDHVKSPVTVNSGTRCLKHNQELKNSSPSSGHMSGEAADIYVNGFNKQGLGNEIKKLYKSGLIPQLTYCYLIADSTRAVHVGVDRRYRKNVFAF